MPAVRRFAVLIGLVAPILAPALVGGSRDFSSEARVRRSTTVTVAPSVAKPVDRKVPLWSPGHEARTRFYPAGTPRELVLSFDDGPDLDGTPLILEELDRRRLKAIFFVTGWRMLGH